MRKNKLKKIFLRCLVGIAVYGQVGCTYADDLEDVRNKLNQVYWRFYANSKIKDPLSEDEHKWIKGEYYRKSIIEVIGKAIADCVTNQNQFAPENREDETIVTFKGTKPQEYSRENWNAVILYNYVQAKINNSITVECASSIDPIVREFYSPLVYSLVAYDPYTPLITKCYNKVRDYYEQNYTGIDMEELSNAKRDIIAYAKALHLDEILTSYQQSMNRWIEKPTTENMAPWIQSEGKENCISVSSGTYYKTRRSTPAEKENLSDSKIYTNLQYIAHGYQPIFTYTDTKLFITNVVEYELKKYRTADFFKSKKRVIEHPYRETKVLKRYTDNALKECRWIYDLLNGLVEPLDR